VGRPDRGEDSGGFTPKRGRESEIGIAAAPDRPVPWVSAPARRCGSRPALVAARRDHPGDPGGLSGEDGCRVFARFRLRCRLLCGRTRRLPWVFQDVDGVDHDRDVGDVRVGHGPRDREVPRVVGVCFGADPVDLLVVAVHRATGCGCGRRSRRGRPRRGCGGDGGGVVSDAGEQPFVRGDGSFGVLAATVSLPVLSDLSWPN